MKKLTFIVLIGSLACQERTAQVELRVDTDKVVSRIDPKVYGHFYEHIYHSANGGLWGDMIFNRSFEESDGTGQWNIAGNVLASEATPGPGARISLGDVAWKDYEFSVDVRMEIRGQVSFSFRATDEGNRMNNYTLRSSADGSGKLTLVRLRRPTAVVIPGRAGRVAPSGGVSPSAASGGFPPGTEEVLGQFDATLQAQSWHSLRVRCEGNRFLFWLDGKQLGDVTDSNQPFLQGRVSVAAANAKAQFRSLKVASLDGKPLLESTPSTARHWAFYGNGGAALDAQQPLNSEVSLHLTGTEGESGIVQTGLRLTRNDRVRGSLWVRGVEPHGVVVRLLDGKKPLTETTLPPPTTAWREYSFDFIPSVTLNNASIQIGVKEKADVRLDQVSLMADSSRETGGFRPDLLQAVAAIKPPIIRWPGGSFIANYRWKDGIGPQSKRGIYPATIWDDRDTNSLGTDEFIALCRRLGAEPLLVINIGHRDNRGLERPAYIQEALDWMEYCNGPADSKWGKLRAANGHPKPYNVKYWEIGNETWTMGADAYVQAVKDFVPQMREKDPSVMIAVCGGHNTSAGNEGNWDETLLQGDVTKLYDYLSIHHYENADRFGEGVQDFDDHFVYLRGLIRTSQNPKIKLYVSEWNVREASDWRCGLYAAGLLNVFERRSDVVEIGGPALFMRHVSAPRWDNAFINFDQTGWFPAPNYVVMKLWHDNFAPNLLAADGDGKGVNFTATKSEKGDKVYLKAVNPGKIAATVKVEMTGGVKPGRATMQLVSPGSLGSRNSLEHPSAVAPKAAQASLQANTVIFTLPPISAGVVTLDAAR
jgi:alpha-L-arabinofuranosidase